MTYNLGSQTTRCAAAFSLGPYPLRKPGEFIYKNRFSKGDILTKHNEKKEKSNQNMMKIYMIRDMFQKKSKCAQGSSRNFCHASRLHRCPLCCRSCHWCGALWQGGGHRYRWGRRRWWPASHVWHEGEIETMNSLADVIGPQKTKLLKLVELLSLSGFQNLNDITHHCYILYSCHLAAICYLYSFLHQHDFSSLFGICSCSNAVSTFNTLSHHTLPTDQNRLNIKHKHVETQV